MFQVVNILCLDFVVFVVDIAKIFVFCLEFCGVVLESVVEGVISLLVNLRDLIFLIFSAPIGVYLVTLYLIDNTIFAVVILAEHIKRAVVLIGTCIWYILMLIPYSLLYTVYLIPVFLIDSIHYARKGASDIILTVGQKLYNGLLKIAQTFSDIPCEAFLGLILGTAVLSVMFQRRTLLVRYMILAYRAHISTVKKLIEISISPLRRMARSIYFYRRSITRSSSRALNGSVSNAKTSPSSAAKSSNVKELQRTLEAELEERLCSVCRERRKSVIVLPCRHLCMCDECVSVVAQISRMCPLCRCPIVNTLKVYV
ncbi:hypothetical protein J437_LFUL014949 [Ladona fulva]|uniref:RING-type domain-containing protein n=1 Tax=Ladona fulva TaxID=123851 RepID=A0A8K0KF72_LADFU|nr:hypothetical protein J437_LFUL014949 [Ladona fulva]